MARRPARPIGLWGSSALVVAGLIVLIVAWLAARTEVPVPPPAAPLPELPDPSADDGQGEPSETSKSAPQPQAARIVPGPFAVQGTVLGPDGGIAAARVEVVGEDGATTSVESELDGSFVTGELPLGLYVIHVVADGYGDGYADDVVPGGPAVVVRLQPGRRVSFLVELPDGRPAAGATCTVGGAGLFPARLAVADSTGRCAFSGLPPGDHELVATLEDSGSRPRAFTLQGDLLPFQVRLQPTAPQTLVAIRLGTAAEPSAPQPGALPHALITIADDPMHVLAFSEITDDSGSSTFRGLVPGRYYVSARASGFLPFGPVAVDVPTKGPHLLELKPGARVAGRVLDEAGQPIQLVRLVARVETSQGARWLVDRDELSWLHHLARPDGTTIGRGTTDFLTDRDGAFEIGGLPGGHVAVEPRKDGWVGRALVNVEVREGERVDGLVLRMERGGRLRARVEGPAGGPLPGVDVRWRIPGDDVWGWRGETRTDVDGAFVLEGVATQSEVELRAEGYVTTMVVIARGAPEEQLVLRLEPMSGRIVGRVLGPGGPLLNARIQRAGQPNQVTECMARTDREGHFELAGCPAGRLRFAVSGPSVAMGWFEAESGQEVELRLGVGGTLRLRLGAADGPAPTEASVTLQANVAVEGSPVPEAVSRQAVVYEGRGELTYLPPGVYAVRVEVPGYAATERGQVAIAHGAVVDLGELALVRDATVVGYVQDTYGSPVGAARVELEGQKGARVSTETGADGAYRLSGVAPGSATLRAVHWALGETEVAVAMAAGSEQRQDLRLEAPVGGGAGWDALLGPDGVRVEREEAGWVVSEVEPTSPWYDNGVQRGDFVESVSRHGEHVVGLTIVRDGARRQVGEGGW